MLVIVSYPDPFLGEIGGEQLHKGDDYCQRVTKAQPSTFQIKSRLFSTDDVTACRF